MNTRRRIGSTFGGLAIGAVATIVLVGAGSQAGAQTASSIPGGDGGATTSFVQSAQRGEVIPPDTEDLEHMCALLASCPDLPLPPQLIPDDFAKCVRKTADEMASPAAVNFSLTMRECGLRTNSCSELKKCVLRGVRADACKGRGQNAVAGLCDADGRAITCFHERVLAVRDCPRGGELCSVRDGQAMCSLGACTPENKEGAPPTCSASGTRILRCEKGRLVSLDCATFGLKCTTGADGAVCSTQTSTCTGTTKRCDGANAVGCFNGHEVKVECSSAGMSCNTGANTAASVGLCASPAAPAGATACDSSAAAKCDGATIKYCFAGKPRSYFCKSLGFNKCVSDSKGARCVN